MPVLHTVSGNKSNTLSAWWSQRAYSDVREHGRLAAYKLTPCFLTTGHFGIWVLPQVSVQYCVTDLVTDLVCGEAIHAIYNSAEPSFHLYSSFRLIITLKGRVYDYLCEECLIFGWKCGIWVDQRDDDWHTTHFPHPCLSLSLLYQCNKWETSGCSCATQRQELQKAII